MVALMRASMREFASRSAEVELGPLKAEDASALDSFAKLDRLADDLASAPAPPFTSQRLCELLLAPREYYAKIEKLVRFGDRAGIPPLNPHEPTPAFNVYRQNVAKTESPKPREPTGA